MTALAIVASATCAAVVAGLMWVIHRLGRAHARPPAPCTRCGELEQLRETHADTVADLDATRAALRDYEQEVHKLRDQLAAASPSNPVEQADGLLARIDALAAENAQLRDGGTREQLLRERETARHLAAELERLTIANLALNGVQ